MGRIQTNPPEVRDYLTMDRIQTKPSEGWDARCSMNEEYQRVQQVRDRLLDAYDAKMDDAPEDDLRYEELFQKKRSTGSWEREELYQKKKSASNYGYSKGGKLDEAILRYAKLDNRYFAAEMQARLPRELRDLVYSYILDADYVKPTLRRMFNSLQGMDYNNIGDKLSYESIGDRPHVIMPEYVDTEMAREAMEAYYRCVPEIVDRFVVDAFVVECPDRIGTMLFEDVFNLGLKPAEFLRTLTVYLTLDDIYGRVKGDIEPETLKKDIAQLHQVVRKKSFKLKIILQQTCIRLKQWDEAFSVLKPFCEEFEAAGAQVHVSWAHVKYGSREHLIIRSIDDIFRQWHLNSEWKSGVIDWLASQQTLHLHHDLNLREDDED